ncbi:immunoglobulin-binding protein 1 isoform 2-T2 [Megaptera novaeangliae]
MATAEDELLLPRLPELFETSKQLLDEVEVATEPTGSRIIQDKVFKGLDLLKKAAEMLLELDLFSRNEDLEEIASTDLKYLMVPAFQGAFAMKQVNPSKRLDHLQWAREHFLNYLTQCQYYHVAEFELPKTKTNSAENNTADSSMAYPSLVAMASQRQAKIERYKQKKEAEHRLSALKSAVESGQADDERIREYYLLHLRRWIGISLEEIESIDQEIKILRGKDSSKEASTSHSSRQDRPPMKPFVLTRNMAQAKVFGAGYPSLASMTVNDWYEQHQKFGALPDQGIAKKTSARSWKQPKCPSTDEWIKKLWYIYTMEYYSAIKRNETESFVETWMDLETVIQSESSEQQLSDKIGNRRKRMMNRRSTELGSGMTGRTPIRGAMATGRTWVSLPTTRQDCRGFCLPHQGKLCSLPLPGLLLQPCTTTKAEMLNLALRSLTCQTIKCVFVP